MDYAFASRKKAPDQSAVGRSDWARKNLPPALHLRFLQDVWPGLFAYRIRAVAIKPG